MYQLNKILTIISILIFSVGFSQIPTGYYDDAQGLTGDDLKSSLHEIINDHIEFSYNDLRDFILRKTDEDPENSDNVILLYTGRSQPKITFGGGANDWNREHVWAKSHGGFGNSPPAGTDAHHIRPTDVSVNSSRGNLDFDIGGSPVNEAPGCFKDGDSFEPRDEVKGDVARMIFYMATRYEGGNGEPDLEVVDEVNTSPNPEHGKLSQLLLWNMQDPPDEFEINRNDVIYYDYQNNRNPYIDHPEFVNLIWGDPSSVNIKQQLDISIFPNPTSDILKIRCGNPESLSYSIYNAMGVLIMSGKFKEKVHQISVKNIRKGLFFLRIESIYSGISTTSTFIKTAN